MNPKKWSHRTRALVNLAFIGFAVLVGYLKLGAPYLSRQQSIDYTMRRCLASNMEVIQAISIPETNNSVSHKTERFIYLFRYENTVSSMLCYSINDISYVQKYPDRDGMAVIPLYGLVDFTPKYKYDGLAVAVIPTNPEIVSVKVSFCMEDGLPVYFDAQEEYDGVFVANCRQVWDSLSFSAYDTDIAYNFLGAEGYDAEGNIIAKTTSFWEEKYETG